METVFMNMKNSKTNESHRFRLSLVDKTNLEDPNKKTALANLSGYYTWKILSQHATTTNLKFLLQLGMMNSICLMDLILLLKSKTTLNLSSKKIKRYLKILLNKITLTKSKAGLFSK